MVVVRLERGFSVGWSSFVMFQWGGWLVDNQAPLLGPGAGEGGWGGDVFQGGAEEMYGWGDKYGGQR